MSESDRHLGNLLMLLADLSDDERCDAHVNALAFYNRMHPEARVERTPGWVSHLINEGPLDRVLAYPYVDSPSPHKD